MKITISSVTASSTLCFTNSGSIDDDLSDANFMTLSTTAAFVNK
jgi:hypothetical protein